MAKQLICILFFLLAGQLLATAQKVTNRGTDFWAGFGHAAEMETTAWLDTPRVALAFSAERDANVQVTLDGTTYKKEYFVPANTVIRTDNLPQGFRDIPAAPWDAMLYSKASTWPGGTNSEGIFKNKGIHIHSDVPIVAYEIEYAPYSAAATMLIPVESWGYSYKVLSHDQTVTEFKSQARFAWVFVIAHYENTKIEVTPANRTRSGLPAGSPVYITLKKGEIYQLMADVPANNLSGTNDLIGTTIKSVANSDGICYPVAAFVGSSGAYVSCGSFTGTHPPEDMAIQQMFPVSAWGKRYLTTPSSVSSDPNSHNYNFFRVMPKFPGSVVTRNGVQLTNFTKGYYEFQSKTADYITSNDPIQVMQIFPSQGTCNYIGQGDPEMIFLSPIEQGIKKVAFQRLAFPGMEARPLTVDWNFLTLNIPTTGLASLAIDGLKNNYTLAYPNPNLPGYSVVVRRWNTRSNTDARAPAPCIVESDSAFNAITYGFSDALSYSYNVGTYINNLSGMPFIKNQYNHADTANAYTCARTPVALSVLIRYKPSKILWKLSELAGAIAPAADVADNTPVEQGTEIVSGVTYYRYKLSAIVAFNKPGTYVVPVYTTAAGVEQCENTELIPYEVIVKDTLQTGFDMLYENCKATELIQFKGRNKFNDSSLIQHWEWSFLNGTVPGTTTGKEVSFSFNEGNNSARLIAVDGNGCIADTAKIFSLVNKPVVPDFQVTGGVACENTELSFSETTPPLQAQSWYWNFGDGNSSDVTANGATITHTYSAYQTVTVKHVVKMSANCISDTARQTITIYAKPSVTITYPKGCLPEDGVVNFSAKGTTADQQVVSAYLWNFGDAAATPGNPNTATMANTLHGYTAGAYQLQLKLTTDKGCVRDSAWEATFQPRPVIQYNPVLPGVCINVSAPVSVAGATVTNSITGAGYYKGPGTDRQGSFAPATAAAGNHTIWYIYEANNGCTDSLATTIFVYPAPLSSFTTAADICPEQKMSFTDGSAINTNADPDAFIKTWTWNFDDGTPEVTVANGNSFERLPAAVKTAYNISLKVISNEGCASELFTKKVTAHLLPQVSFELPAVICMPGGEVAFVNKSTLTEPGVLTYKWQFGDGAVSTETNPSHVYATAQSYPVTLKANSAFGCTATATQNISSNSFQPKPVVAFTVSDLTPCEGTQIQFTDQSSAAPSAISTWRWDFGDGTNAVIQHPLKQYNRFGTYSVLLRVTAQNGCAAETAASAQATVNVLIKPEINAGPDVFAEEGETVTLKASATNASQLKFSWTPADLLNNPAILHPAYVALKDQVFTLTATDQEGVCSATDEVTITLLRSVKIPNVFTPNGDGLNDSWDIRNLSNYTQCTVTVFNRYGQKVYFSQGYAKAWDGTQHGSVLPSGTYYYVIHLNPNDSPISGAVTILK